MISSVFRSVFCSVRSSDWVRTKKSTLLFGLTFAQFEFWTEQKINPKSEVAQCTVGCCVICLMTQNLYKIGWMTKKLATNCDRHARGVKVSIRSLLFPGRRSDRKIWWKNEMWRKKNKQNNRATECLSLVPSADRHSETNKKTVTKFIERKKL